VGVEVVVGVTTGVGVLVGATVGVGVGVDVAVGVGVGVVLVGVTVGVGVGRGVDVGWGRRVGVGWGLPCLPPLYIIELPRSAGVLLTTDVSQELGVAVGVEVLTVAVLPAIG
jgi:hypothetical protein